MKSMLLALLNNSRNGPPSDRNRQYRLFVRKNNGIYKCPTYACPDKLVLVLYEKLCPFCGKADAEVQLLPLSKRLARIVRKFRFHKAKAMGYIVQEQLQKVHRPLEACRLVDIS